MFASVVFFALVGVTLSLGVAESEQPPCTAEGWRAVRLSSGDDAARDFRDACRAARQAAAANGDDGLFAQLALNPAPEQEPEPEVGASGCIGNCFISSFISFHVGCDDSVCQDAVCAIDGPCCSVEWDGICVEEALEEPLCTTSSCPQCSAPSFAISPSDERQCPNPTDTTACKDDDLVLVFDDDDEFACISLSQRPALQTNDDNCEGERERVTITGVQQYGYTNLADINFNPLVGREFKVCSWEVDRSSVAVEKHLQGFQLFDDVNNATFSVRFIHEDAAEILEDEDDDDSELCAVDAVVCLDGATEEEFAYLAYVGGRSTLNIATPGIDVTLTADEDVPEEPQAQQPVFGRKRAQRPVFSVGDASDDDDDTSDSSSSSSSSSANSRQIAVHVTNNNEELAVGDVKVVVHVVGDGKAQLQRVERGVVERGTSTGELVWHIERLNPSESSTLVLFGKGHLRSATASVTVGATCEEFSVACRDRADDATVVAELEL